MFFAKEFPGRETGERMIDVSPGNDRGRVEWGRGYTRGGAAREAMQNLQSALEGCENLERAKQLSDMIESVRYLTTFPY